MFDRVGAPYTLVWKRARREATSTKIRSFGVAIDHIKARVSLLIGKTWTHGGG